MFILDEISCGLASVYYRTRWLFQTICIFNLTRGDDPIWTYFSNGLEFVGGKVLNLCFPGCPWKRRSPLRPLAPKALMPVPRTVLCDLWMFSSQSSWDLGVSGWVLLISCKLLDEFRRMRPFKGSSRVSSRTNHPTPWWRQETATVRQGNIEAQVHHDGVILFIHGLMLNFRGMTLEKHFFTLEKHILGKFFSTLFF